MINNPYSEGQILVIDKPLEWTSFDLVNKIRYAIKDKYKIKKIKVGHAGTLDPLATGVVVVCTGKKTKIIDGFLVEDKEYVGKIQLGSTTPSFDLETDVDNYYKVPYIDQSKIDFLIKKFSGEIDQVPPIYSAKRINGKRAYQFARANEKISLTAKKVEIKELDLFLESENILSFRCKCSKGTYIRALARDIGFALNSGAFLIELRRIRSGSFSIDDAKLIDDWVDIIKSS